MAEVELTASLQTRSTDRQKQRIRTYEEMVDFLRNAEQLTERRAGDGRLAGAEVQRARLATVEARIALEKLRLGQTQ